MPERTTEYGETGAYSLQNFEDVPWEVKDMTLFMRVKKSSELDDPTRPEVDQGFLVGPWYAEFEAPREMGSYHIAQLVGKNVVKQPKAGQTIPAGSQGEAPKIRFVKNWNDLDTEFKAFEDYAEHSKFACNSGRPLAQGENGLALGGTGGLLKNERMWTDLGTLIADQETGKYSPAVFAMDGDAIDERLNAGLQTFWNVRKDKENAACLCWNMDIGSGYGSGRGLMWWKNADVINICNYIDYGPFRYGKKGYKVDKHWQKRNEDDEDIISLHFDPNKTYWYISQIWDAPSLHEGETEDRGGVDDEIKQVQWLYYDKSSHPSPRDGTGRMLWITFDKIKKGTPPKTPPVLDPPHDPKWSPFGNKPILVPGGDSGLTDYHDKDLPNSDYSLYGGVFPSALLNYTNPVNTSLKNKFQARSSSQNISFPCIQFLGQIPNQYAGEEGYDWLAVARQKMNDTRFMSGFYLRQPSLIDESESETLNAIAGYLGWRHAQSTRNSRPNIANIDGIGKVKTISNKSQFDYTHHPKSNNASYEQGTASGMVTVYPPEMSNHWDSGALGLSTLHFGFYETVPMGWFRAVDDDATMTDKRSTFFIPTVDGAGDLDLDLWFYTTGAARSGIFTVHGTIVPTVAIFKGDNIPQNYGNTAAAPDFSTLWDTTLTPHSFHLRDNGVTAGAFVRMTTERLELDNRGVETILIGTDAGKDSGGITDSILIGNYAGDLGATFVGDTNVGVGHNFLSFATTANENVGMGHAILYQCVVGAENSAFGTQAGYNCLGSNNLFAGNRAGFYQAAVSNYMIFDTILRVNAADELVKAPLWITTAAATVNQHFRVNANVYIPDDLTLGFGDMTTPDATFEWENASTRLRVRSPLVYYDETTTAVASHHAWNLIKRHNPGVDNALESSALQIQHLYNPTVNMTADISEAFKVAMTKSGAFNTAQMFGFAAEAKNMGAGTITTVYANYSQLWNNGAGVITTGIGNRSFVYNRTGDMGTVAGYESVIWNRQAGDTITTAYNYKADALLIAGTITTLSSFYAPDLSGEATTWIPIDIGDSVSTSYLGGSYNIIRQLDVEGYSAFGNGLALDANRTVAICRDFTQAAGTFAAQLQVGCTITGVTADNAYGGYVAPTGMIQVAGGISTPLISSFFIGEPAITVHTDPGSVVTKSAALTLNDSASEATVNYGLLLKNGARTYNDIYMPTETGKIGGANNPTWGNMKGNTKAYTFALNDYIDLPSQEIAHSYDEGTDVEVHVHIVLDGSDVGDTYVNYEVEYTYANNGTTLTNASVSGDLEIPGGTADETHLTLNVGTISVATLEIGANITVYFRRIPLVGGGLTAPSNDPWVTMVGLHILEDSIGSRSLYTKN